MASPVLEILTLGLVLSADSFSAAFAMGHRPFTSRDALRFALASGSAEALSALIGALGGSFILSRFASIDHWIAFGLLTAIALHMLWEGLGHLRSGLPPGKKEEFHGPLRILMVSFATSLDALGVGVGFGVTGKPILPFLGSIGIWAFLATLAGLHLSRRLTRRAGPLMAIVGAGVLEIIAIQMLKA